jgi:hypothetical protein
MLYKPNFCCNCGEKIERKDWTVFTSRRFCGVCETEFKGVDYLPRAVTALAAITLLVGAAGLFRSDRKLPASAGIDMTQQRRFVSTNKTPDQNLAISTDEGKTNKLLQNTPQQNIPTSQAIPDANSLQRQPAQKTSTEAVYFCGALTKKGTPCTRRVKTKGARCFQHVGQPSAVDLK